MNERLRGTVWFVALQLVFMAALVHVALGVWEWSRWARAGFLVPRDLRWPVFVASGLVVLYGLHRSLYTEARDPYYLAGIVVMLGYAGGYFAWHLVGHPTGLDPSTWLTNEAITLQWFLDHLLAGPVEFFAIAVEVGAAVLLAVLYLSDPVARADSDAQEQDSADTHADGDSAGATSADRESAGDLSADDASAESPSADEDSA